MKKLLLIPTLLLCGCTTLTTWRSQLAPEGLANQAVTAAAEHYGGEKGKNLASAALYASADVLQGYVDKKPPIDVILQSPGVEGVGHVVLDYVKEKGWISQETVNNLHKAAEFALRVTYTKPNK